MARRSCACATIRLVRRLLPGLLAATALLAFSPSALGAIAEIRDAQGHLVAAARQGSFASLQDGGWTLRFDSSSRSSRGVSVRGVTIAAAWSMPSASSSRHMGSRARWCRD
jgi:hypothetical protein